MKVNITPEVKDKIQIEKKQFEHKKHLDKRLTPHKNHKVFEYNKETFELKFAEFDNTLTIKWEDAVNENYSKYRTITKKDNCIYFSALNIKNAQKILERDFNIYNNL